MTFSEKQIAELSAPLHAGHVKSRQQAGRKLSYIEGWHAIAEANRIFGFDAWTRQTIDMRVVAEAERPIGQQGGKGWGVSYIAKVRVTVQGVIREGVGTGHGIDRDLGLAHESAIKEAETDAMKRALMTFGNPFGLALYDKTQANVCDDEPNSAPQARNAGAGKSAPPLPPAPATNEPPSEAFQTAVSAMKVAPSRQALREWWQASRAGLEAVLTSDEWGELERQAKVIAATLPETDERNAA
jgi:DNA recombination protein Rad52